MEELEKSSWFWPPKNPEDEAILQGQANPKSTQYKNKWAADSLKNWQMTRDQNLLRWSREVCSKIMIFIVCKVLENLEDMDSLSRNYWLTKFVQ